MIDPTVDRTSVREELPGVTTQIHLNTASFGPLLRCVSPAINAWLEKECFEGRLGMAAYAAMGALYDEARGHLARFMNAQSDEIALTGNTGEGLNIVCHGLDWQSGDEIIITDHEHISLLVLVHYIRDRYGVTVRVADLGPGLQQPAEEAIARLITPRTRLIILSHISFMTGAVMNVRAVSDLAHQSGILVLADGAQSAGVIPIDVKELGVDFYAFPMQKWLCGPDGTGALYVRRDVLDRLQLTYVGGWFSLNYTGLKSWIFKESAQRFELGGRQTAGVAGQIACLRWLEEIATFEWVYNRISALNAYAYDAVSAIPGAQIHTPRSGASGLLTFSLEGHNPAPIVPWLQHEHKIHVRAMFEYNALRVSTNFFNIEEEIDQLAEALRIWQRRGGQL
ncbi:MAG TPA: aminotransferase class V-fold PLP-dependent enzyme [Herpetosiphonaceae bacterium]